MKPTEKDLQTAREYIDATFTESPKFLRLVYAEICTRYLFHLESIGKIKFTEGRELE